MGSYFFFTFKQHGIATDSLWGLNKQILQLPALAAWVVLRLDEEAAVCLIVLEFFSVQALGFLVLEGVFSVALKVGHLGVRYVTQRHGIGQKKKEKGGDSVRAL